MLKKVFVKIVVFCCFKCLVFFSILLVLYRSFVLLYFEYCNFLLIGIGKIFNKKLEDVNYYGFWIIMNLGRSINYELIFKIVDMNILEYRCIE